MKKTPKKPASAARPKAPAKAAPAARKAPAGKKPAAKPAPSFSVRLPGIWYSPAAARRVRAGSRPKAEPAPPSPKKKASKTPAQKPAPVKPAPKKAPAPKAPAAKPVSKKAPVSAKKAPAKPGAKKAPAKPVTKKPPEKKTAEKKPPEKKMTEKKPPEKKTAEKKTTEKKTTEKKVVVETASSVEKPVEAEPVKAVETQAGAEPAKTEEKKADAAGADTIERLPSPPAFTGPSTLPPEIVPLVPSFDDDDLFGDAADLPPQETAPFTKKELAEFRAMLIALRSRHSGKAASLQGQSLTRADEVNPEEDGTDASMRITEISKATIDENAVNDIDAALRAIEEGTFGVCQTCGKRIGKSRLRARPYAKNCVSCQTEMERDAARRRASPSSEFYN